MRIKSALSCPTWDRVVVTGTIPALEVAGTQYPIKTLIGKKSEVSTRIAGGLR
jgi:hypothetical protein